MIRDIFEAMTSQGSVLLGVTGHRNFTTDDPALTELTEHECNRLLLTYPKADFRILSGLAEGADRLVVRVAQRTLNAKLVAITPMPRDLYVQDFSSADSQSEYRDFLGEAYSSIDAPLLASYEAISEYGEPRNHQYAWQGAFIAKRAQILFAIWDGAPARGTGGTAQVVEWFSNGKTPDHYKISKAKRMKVAAEVKRELIHINPLKGTVEVTSVAAPVK